MNKKRFSVLIPRPFPTALDYRSEYLHHVGEIVYVPLGHKKIYGCIWPVSSDKIPKAFQNKTQEEAKKLPLEKLRDVIETDDETTILPETLCDFISWVAAYNFAAPGMVLAIALRTPMNAKRQSYYKWRLSKNFLTKNIKITPQRASIINVLEKEKYLSLQELKEKSSTSQNVIHGLEKKGVIEKFLLPATLVKKQYKPTYTPNLSTIQKEAAKLLIKPIEDNKFLVSLLEGVTGSGKTEVYFEAIEKAISQDKQCLILLPEISLTAQLKERFIERFGETPAIWHSELTARKRRNIWDSLKNGTCNVVIGARSALFLPFIKLGLIIVDEEHETTYKQEEGILYHGRDMAIVRAKLLNIPIILASATPSLETLYNAQNKRYQHVQLMSRYGHAQLPTIKIIDMQQQKMAKGDFISPFLNEKIKETLNRGEQVLLFLNRRGYAPLTLCKQCGYRVECPNCSTWLVEHRRKNIMACHYCEYTTPVPQTCPQCEEEDTLIPIGPGIERIKEEAEKNFPQANILSMASDTFDNLDIQKKAIKDIDDGKINLIIGTQIAAKGWDFPNLTLVGVIDSDLSLSGGDLRAGEHTMQLMNQVSGRAGRHEKAGFVYLQSYSKDHPVIQAIAKNNYNEFIQKEATQRQLGNWPPFGRLAAIIISANTEQMAQTIAQQLCHSAPHAEGIKILGPTPAPISLLRGKWRQRILLKTNKNIAPQNILRRWLKKIKIPSHIKITIDIDPISFL